MASSVIYFVNKDGDEMYCFTCACKAAINEGKKIKIESSDYDFHQCSSCDCFLDERIVV